MLNCVQWDFAPSNYNNGRLHHKNNENDRIKCLFSGFLQAFSGKNFCKINISPTISTTPMTSEMTAF